MSTICQAAKSLYFKLIWNRCSLMFLLSSSDPQSSQYFPEVFLLPFLPPASVSINQSINQSNFFFFLSLEYQSRRPDSHLGGESSGHIPIRLLYCILSSRAPNEVGVNINWDGFRKGRSSVFLISMPKKATARLHWSLTQLTSQEIVFGKLTRLSPHVRVWPARLLDYLNTQTARKGL